MADPQMVVPPRDDTDVVYLPVADGTDLGKQGDWVSYESNAAVLMDAVTEDATFAGAIIVPHVANEVKPDEVTVALKCQCIYDASSATFAFGAGLKYSARNTVVADGGYNTIAWSAKYQATVTRVRTLIDVIALGKLFPVSA